MVQLPNLWLRLTLEALDLEELFPQRAVEHCSTVETIITVWRSRAIPLGMLWNTLGRSAYGTGVRLSS